MKDDKDLDEILRDLSFKQHKLGLEGLIPLYKHELEAKQALNRHYYQKFLEMLEEQKSAAEKSLNYQVDKTGNQNLIREWTGTVQGIQFCIDAAKRKLVDDIYIMARAAATKDRADAAINAHIVSVLEELKEHETVIPLYCNHTSDKCRCKRTYVVVSDDIDAAIAKYKREPKS